MPRRRAKRPPEQDAPARSGRALFAAGTIRNPGERESLAVTLTIGRGQVSLHADSLELGAWPEDGVEITPIDATSFAFTAEGDRMIFRPDDVITFTEDLGTQVAVAAPSTRRQADPPKPRRRRRRRQTAHDDAAPSTDRSGAGEEVSDRTDDTDTSVAPPSNEAPQRPTRTPPGVSMPKVSMPNVSMSKVRMPGVTRSKVAERETSTRPPRARKADTPERTGTSGRRPSLWLRTVDMARHQGWFSLDRVPVYEDQRGQDHDHTWNHRAVATSGPSRHVCTICGRIKLR